MRAYRVEPTTLKIGNTVDGSIIELEGNTTLKFKSGKVVALPDEFEVLAIRGSEIIAEKVRNLKVGDLIAMPRRLPSNNQYQKLDNKTPLTSKVNIVPKLPHILSEELAYLVGIISSDGYIRKDNKIVLINKDKRIISKFKKLIKRLFALKVGIISWKEKRKGKIYRWINSIVYSKALKEYLAINFGLKEGKKNEYLRVPEVIFNSPKSVIAKYLQGLFDGDGSIIIGKNNVAIKLTAKNRDFAYDIQELLLFFDIIGYVKKTRNNLWEVVISSRINVEKFKKEIGFSHSEKAKKIKKAISKKKVRLIQIGRIIKRERNKQKISLRQLCKKLGIGETTLRHYENDDCLPKIRVLKKLAQVLRSKELLKIANSKDYRRSIRERHKLSGFRKFTNDDVLPKEIARECILQIKEKYKVSQEKIAKSIGTSQGRIGNYERGNAKISYGVIKKLSKNFPTSLISLIANSDIFWDKIIEITSSNRKITWKNVKEFIYYNRIIAKVG